MRSLQLLRRITKKHKIITEAIQTDCLFSFKITNGFFIP